MTKTPEDLIIDIQAACAELGWCIALKEDEDHVSGLVVGTLDYIKEILTGMEDGEDYEIWVHGGDADDEQLH